MVRKAESQNSPVTCFRGFFYGMGYEFAAQALTVEFRCNEYWAETYRRNGRQVRIFGNNRGMRKENAADNLVFVFHDKTEFGNKILVRPHGMDDIMFMAARKIKIPERFPCRIFGQEIFLFLFVPYYSLHGLF